MNTMLMFFARVVTNSGFLGTPKTLSGMLGFQRLQRNVVAYDVKKLVYNAWVGQISTQGAFSQ